MEGRADGAAEGEGRDDFFLECISGGWGTIL